MSWWSDYRAERAASRELGTAMGQLDIYRAQVRGTEHDGPGYQREVLDWVDRAVADAPSAAVLGRAQNLWLPEGVPPTRENYQAEWGELKEDMRDRDIQERADAIDPLTREDDRAVRESVDDEWGR